MKIKVTISARRLLLLATIFALSFSFGRLLVVAQEWTNPTTVPPTNNAGQPPDISSFDAYVRKSVTDDQYVTGPVNIGTEVSYPADLGEDGGLSSVASIISNGTAGSVVMYADDLTGVYSYGVGMDYGLFGYASSTTATSTGLIARGTNGALAARFYGPVVGVDSATTTVISTVTAEQGITCLSGSCTVSNTDWISSTHTNDGTALYGLGTSVPGIDINIDDGVVGNGYGIDSYSLSGYGAVGSGRPGVYASADTTLSIKAYGLYAVHGGSTTGSSSYIGVQGVSTGGLGTLVNTGSDAQPQYDFAAGIRACVKDDSAAITIDQGLDSIAPTAGYFDGDQSGTNAGDVLIVSVCSNDSYVQCSSDSDCGLGSCIGQLKIGSTVLTETNLRGIVCKLNGTPVATCHAAAVCGNSTLEAGEECDDGNTTSGDGCSSACVAEQGYAYRAPVTFAGTGSGTYTDVPILIHLTNSNFNFSNLSFTDGTDIALYDQSLNLLDFEIEEISSSEAWIWFRYPSYNRASPDYIWIYYGNPSASNAENPTGVWNSSYAGVWHMNEDPSLSIDGDCGGSDKEVCDSTGNNNDSDSVGGMATTDSITGKIGNAIAFDGLDDYLNTTHNASFDIGSDITLSAWVNPDSIYPASAWYGYIAKTDGLSTWDYSLSMGDMPYIYSTNIPGDGAYWSNYTGITAGNWQHILFTRSGTSWEFWVNGSMVKSGTDGSTFDSNTLPLRIGTDGPDWVASSVFEGSMDEVRVENVARDSQWIGIQYASMIGSLASVGAEESL